MSILSDEAHKFINEEGGNFSQLETITCPRCKQHIFIKPGEIIVPGNVCDDCMVKYWNELYHMED